MSARSVTFAALVEKEATPELIQAVEQGKISVSFRAHDGHYSLTVEDNGIGLPKENRSRLLEPYVTTREKGTGLGLAIVGRIVEEHGGTIDLRDAAEKIPGQRGAWVRMRIAAAGKADAAEPEKQKSGSE